jgi:hypothetical protein
MCTLVTWARSGLKTAGSFQARALFIGLGLLQACSKIGLGLGVRPAGLAQNPGPHGLGLLVYVVKAQAHSILTVMASIKGQEVSLWRKLLTFSIQRLGKSWGPFFQALTCKLFECDGLT